MKETAFREDVVIITGASFGIGQQLALQLADCGAWLVLASCRLQESGLQYHNKHNFDNRLLFGHGCFFGQDSSISKHTA